MFSSFYEKKYWANLNLTWKRIETFKNYLQTMTSQALTRFIYKWKEKVSVFIQIRGKINIFMSCIISPKKECYRQNDCVRQKDTSLILQQLHKQPLRLPKEITSWVMSLNLCGIWTLRNFSSYKYIRNNDNIFLKWWRNLIKSIPGFFVDRCRHARLNGSMVMILDLPEILC